jgi:hypothetical protein
MAAISSNSGRMPCPSSGSLFQKTPQDCSELNLYVAYFFVGGHSPLFSIEAHWLACRSSSPFRQTEAHFQFEQLCGWFSCRMKQPKMASRTECPSSYGFVPVCASKGAALLQSALKSKKRVESNQADTSEVANYQALALMIQIPSLAPIFQSRLRVTAANTFTNTARTIGRWRLAISLDNFAHPLPSKSPRARRAVFSR